jgi:hypothetical protein
MFRGEVAEGQKVVIEALGAPDLHVMSTFNQTRNMRVESSSRPTAGEEVPHGNPKKPRAVHLTMLPRLVFRSLFSSTSWAKPVQAVRIARDGAS